MQHYSEEQIWSFLDEDLKKILDIIRERLNLPLTINQPKMGVFQRGLRCHQCDLVKNNKSPYISAHVQGKAVDILLPANCGITAEKARQDIEDFADELPCNIRFEHMQNGVPISWVHVDVRDNADDKKVYWF
jgi:hypothetical protein